MRYPFTEVAGQSHKLYALNRRRVPSPGPAPESISGLLARLGGSKARGAPVSGSSSTGGAWQRDTREKKIERKSNGGKRVITSKGRSCMAWHC